MHRFVWDLRWTVGDSGDEQSEYGAPRGPRAVPGTYEVRLTVDGKTWTQPLAVTMDPRSSATARDLEQQLDLGRKIYSDSLAGRRLLTEINSVRKQLSDVQSRLKEHGGVEASITDADDEINKILTGEADPNHITGLQTANAALASALRVVESGDRTAPAQSLEMHREARAAMDQAAQSWNSLKTTRLPELNRQLQQANLPPLTVAGNDR